MNETKYRAGGVGQIEREGPEPTTLAGETQSQAVTPVPTPPVPTIPELRYRLEKRDDVMVPVDDSDPGAWEAVLASADVDAPLDTAVRPETKSVITGHNGADVDAETVREALDSVDDSVNWNAVNAASGSLDRLLTRLRTAEEQLRLDPDVDWPLMAKLVFEAERRAEAAEAERDALQAQKDDLWEDDIRILRAELETLRERNSDGKKQFATMERLRAENAAMHRDFILADRKREVAEAERDAAQFYNREFVKNMTAENARLREALRDISMLTSHEDQEGHPTYYVEGAASIARAALRETSSSGGNSPPETETTDD